MEKGKEGALENATELKKEVVEIINEKVVVYLRAISQVNPEIFSVFTSICEQIIADNNEQVKKTE